MFVTIYDFFLRRRRLAWLLFVLSFAIAGVLAGRLRLSEDISSMLPQSPELRAMNNVVARTQAGGQLIFLASFSDSATRRDSLISVVNAYAEGLKAACGPWVDTIRLQAGTGVEEQLAGIFSTRLPLLLKASDYATLDSLTQPERIRQTLA